LRRKGRLPRLRPNLDLNVPGDGTLAFDLDLDAAANGRFVLSHGGGLASNRCSFPYDVTPGRSLARLPIIAREPVQALELFLPKQKPATRVHGLRVVTSLDALVDYRATPDRSRARRGMTVRSEGDELVLEAAEAGAALEVSLPAADPQRGQRRLVLVAHASTETELRIGIAGGDSTDVTCRAGRPALVVIVLPDNASSAVIEFAGPGRVTVSRLEAAAFAPSR
jgi:hypothetical protein